MKTVFRRITSRDKPENLARTAARHHSKLLRALDVARTRAARPVIRMLFSSAIVEGRITSSPIKASVVTYTAEPFKGNLHEIIDWQTIDAMSEKELASILAWSLRYRLRQKERRV